MSKTFFPQMTRSQYKTKDNGSWYAYRHYEVEITNDCLERCVYCDVHIKEIGLEGFHLDHFRPQDVFPDLINTPDNLVIGCPKCNRWKSSHWPVSVELGLTHNDNVGFIDPFGHNRLDFFKVNSDGTLTPLKGPSQYLINLLNLNRASRVLVRRNRLLSCKLDQLIQLAELTIQQTSNLIDENKPKELIKAKLKLAQAAIADIKDIRGTLNA